MINVECNYAKEKREALDFLEKFKHDPIVYETIRELKRKIYMHSDRWSRIYDMMADAYPEYTNGGVITGLTYLIEEGAV